MAGNFFSLGIMSGTSLDGIDLALCQFSEINGHYSYKILKSETLSYTENWGNRLKTAHLLNAPDFMQLHHDYGKLLGQKVNLFLKGTKVRPHIISSHGHTIFHRPDLGYTTQIGSGADIAAISGITTVCDFRDADVAHGGQGAPLVPIGDELLFNEFSACLNLGGISNISFRKNRKRRIAFDISVVNLVLNALAGQLGYTMDKDGLIAASGKINVKLFNELNRDPFYRIKSKKSIGREWVEKNVFPKLKKNPKLKTEDLISTFTEHSAFQIGRCLQENKIKDVLVTGGGAYNKHLLSRIQNYSSAKIIFPDAKLIEFKEALIFAFLGYLRMQNKNNILSSVTGAKKESCGGSVWQA